jgi:hypothetical protein
MQCTVRRRGNMKDLHCQKQQIVRASVEHCYIIEDYSKTLCKNMHFFLRGRYE